MRKMLLICLMIFSFSMAYSQNKLVDSFKIELTKATTNEKKLDVLSMLSRTLMSFDLEQSEMYGLQMIEIAEMSRDRKLMVKALMDNGERYYYQSRKKENNDKAVQYYLQALDIAKKNKFNSQTVSAYLALSEISRVEPAPEKALNYSNQAYSYVSLIDNDSLLAKTHLEYGSVYILKNENILALKNFMQAIKIGEELKNHSLLRIGYIKLSEFYGSIEDYDKAIDYFVKANQKLDVIINGQTKYLRVQDLSRIGDLYAAKKNYDMAMRYYERSLNMADSLNYAPLKAATHRSITSVYVQKNQPEKALQYMHNQAEWKNYLISTNASYYIDLTYGYLYTQLKNYDSAMYYYNKVAYFVENDLNIGGLVNYHYQIGLIKKGMGDLDASEFNFLKAKELADNIGEFETKKVIALELDSLYRLKGDFKTALYYNGLLNAYEDSLEKAGKEKDLLQIEVEDEQQRLERAEKEKIEAKKKRDNIQYLLITIGIISLFIIMVMMGMFKVSKTTIKMVGFFAFLMFFEFIFLVFKKNIYAFTKGEPWKDLMLMILLAAILLPLHHWLEHKVIHYLTSQNRLTATGKGIVDRVLKIKKKEEPSAQNI